MHHVAVQLGRKHDGALVRRVQIVIGRIDGKASAQPGLARDLDSLPSRAWNVLEESCCNTRRDEHYLVSHVGTICTDCNLRVAREFPAQADFIVSYGDRLEWRVVTERGWKRARCVLIRAGELERRGRTKPAAHGGICTRARLELVSRSDARRHLAKDTGSIIGWIAQIAERNAHV